MVTSSEVAIGNEPLTDFLVAPELSEFQVPVKQYLASRTDVTVDVLGTGVIVFHNNYVLLVQRSITDSNPGRWETPGGACDDEDSSILVGAARELWEEAGLYVEAMLGTAGTPWFFRARAGKVIKVIFVAKPKTNKANDRPVVKLSHEHDDYVWATREEVELGSCGEKAIPFTSPNQKKVILDAFAETRWH